jgi:Protein of unknown function (DUF3800)
MKICFIDESGDDADLPAAASNIQPALVIVGVILDYTKLHQATSKLISLKQRFYPHTAVHGHQYLAAILAEIKGSELRKNACESNKKRRHVFGFLKGVLDICEELEARIVGRVWIKGIAQAFDGMAVYTSSIQAMCSYFHDYLAKENDLGIIIADHRTKGLNVRVAHSIFTQKFKSSGDLYDRILELPTFAHSDNHAGLQIADFIGSAIVTPLAVQAYCASHLTGVHIRANYRRWPGQYSARIKALQHRYQQLNGRWIGGITVSDAIGQRPGTLLFHV